MSDINEIKQALTTITPGPWQRMGARIYPMESNRYSENEICWSDSIPNAQFFMNAPTWISSLITTIESQKEEIEKLKSRLEAKYTFISNGMEEDQYVLQESVMAKNAEIESLKAITELAVKGLQRIEDGNSDYPSWSETADELDDVRLIAKQTLDEIERLQHGTPS